MPNRGLVKATAAQQAEWLPVLLGLNSTLLAGTTPDQKAALLADSRIRHLRRRQHIMRQGMPVDGIYLILSGQVEISFTNLDGHRILIDFPGPGAIVGDIEQLAGRPSIGNCVAMPNTTVMWIDADVLLRHIPPQLLLRNLACAVHGFLTRDNHQQSVAMFYTSEERIRIQLLYMTKGGTTKAWISQASLAEFAGCSRQTVNKTLSQLRADGIVAIGRGSICILDRDKLQAMTPAVRTK